jgi:hypothetical protein
MGIENTYGNKNGEAGPQSNFEAIALDLSENVSILSDLIGSYSDMPPEAEEALGILQDKLDAYASTY